MRRTLVILVVLAVLIGGGAFLYFQQQTNSARAAATSRTTTQITRGSIVASVTGAGNLYAPQQTNLNFQLTGVPITKVNVQVGDKVKAGDVLAQVDDSDLQFTLRSATANLASAQTKMDQLKLPPAETDVAAAQAQIAAAQANYDAAVSKNSHAADQITVAKVALEKATITLQGAQAAYNAVAWRSDIGMLPQSAALQNATVDYQSALANYNITLSGINDSAVKSAAQSVVQAQANLTKLTQPPTPQDISLSQSAIDVAQVNFDQAKRKLDQAKIIAPFDGTVAAVNYVSGQLSTASATLPMVTLVNLDTLQTQITLSEVDIPKIKMGQQVTLSFDALNGASFPGKIVSISPVGTTTQGVVNYVVTVALTKTDPNIRPGMTANAQITVDRRDNVFNVPNRAIKTTGNQRQITLLFGGQDIPVIVQTGLVNDTNTEIVSARTTDGPVDLHDGDVVLLNQTTTTTGNRGGIGIPFGGGGGPGR